MNEGQAEGWVIFDADNTLWSLEPLYNSARASMAEYVSFIGGIDVREVEDHQQERDRQLQEIYGYSAARFARSFEDTLYHFVPAALPEQVRHVRALAEAVFAEKPGMIPDVELVLRSLYSRGWQLGLLTAGESWVQQKRISEFHLQGIFHAIEVVERKTPQEFERFCKKHNVDSEKCWVVGDSLRSDIIPARRAKLQAILVPHENWAVVEGVGEIEEGEYTRVGSLRDILDVLHVRPVDFRPVFRSTIDCYGIFEGGGAKGLAHVGALKACEERKISFKGVAGTSAGAIIAGLVAVGYTADELFSATRQDGDCAFDLDYITLLGRHEWHRAEGVLESADHCISGLENVQDDRVDASATTPVAWLRRQWANCQALYYWTKLGFALRPLEAVAADLGYFSLSGFEQWYNDLLARKLRKQGLITFGDIDFDLRIISADLRDSKIVIHSRQTCASRPVAQAVAASICIPLVFKPQQFGEELHVDGGMLSNFPAWVFNEQGKTSVDQLPVVGFELVDRSTALPAHPELTAFLRALSATAISGKKGLEIRGIQNIHFVSIPVSANTLQFDTNREMRLGTYSEGLEAARGFFPTCLQLVTQEQMAPFLFQAHGRIIESVGRPVHLRINVMDQNSLGRLSIRFRYNMDFDPDDRMDLRLEAGGAGQCFTSGRPIIVDLYRAKREYPRFKMSKYEQALVRSTLRSLLSVPIFDPRSSIEVADRRVIGVLNLDSDDLSAEEIEGLMDAAIEISAMISYVWLELAEKGEVRSET
jgi:predicted acylesterase/phospholipase RssA/FMN phosphatase YigB (HAD superfamily)